MSLTLLPRLSSPVALPAAEPGIAQRSRDFVALFIKWSWIVLLVASSFQILFFASLPNLLAVACIGVSWALFTQSFLRPATLSRYPLSSLLVFGFTTTQLYFPLLFTSLENKPIIFNLDLPYQVFLHSSLALLVVLAAHAVYRALTARGPARPTILLKLGFFDPPADLQLWLMGGVGLAATYYVYLYSSSAWTVTGSAADKIIEALIPFSYAPFFIPFGKLYGSNKPLTTKVALLLLVHTLLLFLVSIARNSRGGFMIGFSSVGFAYALGLLLGVYKTQFFTVRNLFLVLGAYWLFTGPIVDIGSAMVVVRSQRHDITYTELLASTWDAYNDKEAIRLYRLSVADETKVKGTWDENYLNNIFLARFCNLKFNDLSLTKAALLTEHDPRMLRFSLDYSLAELPQPALNALNLTSVDKLALKGASVGDYLYYITDGPPTVLGWYLTGHFAGTGMATFGWWYLLVLGVGLVPLYFVFDKFFLRLRPSGPAGALPPFRFSLCGVLVLDSIFRFLPVESVISIPNYLLRGWLQLLLCYFLLYHLTRLLARPFVKQTVPAQ